MRAIQVTEFGGPEVLELREIDDPVVPEGAIAIDVEAAGVNYADTHQAENSYLAPAELPLVPGAEVVGRTADGRRVVALTAAGGGYAERAVTYPNLVWDIPEGVSDGQALSTVLQGATAWHLLKTSSHMAAGETVVVHAAAGGVGSIAVQLAKRWGAGRVIGTASSEEKRALALDLGADAVVDSRSDDLKKALVEANDGRKVDVILDMVGGPTFDAGLNALAPFGRIVTYGMASRIPPSPIETGMLMGRSRAVVGFWLAHCYLVPGMLDIAISELLGLIAAGELRPVVGGSYPLAEARRAHEDIRGRGTTGKLVLVP
ncbi:MAG TPA: zinc-binding dehydrogenase [Solirubrobacterales bacterium]|jgi:NADPH2:quinone reductase|nr:zinc-binding dehydrogenase [Solirubrobacterales bacterium]